jgi:hypothetical protein
MVKAIMESFKHFLKTDQLKKITKTSYDDAIQLAKPIFDVYKRNIIDELPEFGVNYIHSKKLVLESQSNRITRLKLTPLKIKEIQKILANGYANPEKNSFPDADARKTRLNWLSTGVDINGTKIQAIRDYTRLSKLKPSQYQIYLEPTMEKIALYGSELAKEKVVDSIFLVTSDGYILDGHNRWLGGFWIDKNLRVLTYKLNIKLEELVP